MHIARGSCRVRVGERVAAGQVICASGDVGFCPEPHLHIELHEAVAPTREGAAPAAAASDDDDDDEQEQQRAPSIPLAFAAAGSTEVFAPRAGQWYSARGPCAAPCRAARCPLAKPLRSPPDAAAEGEGEAAVEVADLAVELADSRVEGSGTACEG